MNHRTQFGAGRSIVWLASYPKSGNTWLRALLTAYLSPEATPELDDLLGAPYAFDRTLLEDYAAIDASELTVDELLPYQSAFHRELARIASGPIPIKTHSEYRVAADGTELFPAAASAGAILVVRNPLDIVASYAHHEGKTHTAIVARMEDEAAMQDAWPDRIGTALPQRLSSWSRNVASWLDQGAIPIIVVKYEDLSRDPLGTFRRVVEFCGLELAMEQLERAVENCRFERLKAIEARTGFGEKPAAGRRFFRAGAVGAGAAELERDLACRICERHGPVMTRLGYRVDEARFCAC